MLETLLSRRDVDSYTHAAFMDMSLVHLWEDTGNKAYFCELKGYLLEKNSVSTEPWLSM